MAVIMQDLGEQPKTMNKLKERIDHLVDDWATHSASFRRTGFWGAFGGAGGIFLARDTGRLLLARRSYQVLQPGTWGTIDHGEGPEDAVMRETQEELGVQVKPEDFHLCYVFRDDRSRFVYYNYTVLVPQEFEPQLNWEVSDHAWIEFAQWPEPLHFGMQAWLQDARGESMLRNLVEQIVDASNQRHSRLR